MSDWDVFVEGLKEFWNQPVPIIGFTVGTCIVGLAFIISKTQIGKKALNKLKALYNDLKARIEAALIRFSQMEKEYEEFKEKANEAVKNKENEIRELTANYELKLNNYKNELLKQGELLKIVCENSVNKKIKEAYENYKPEILDLPVSEIKAQIEEQVKTQYDERIAKLEELIYGEETKDN